MGHQQFLEQAIKLASENVKAGEGGPFGAVIVKDGKVIGSGVNKVTTIHDPTAHAEVQAIRAACKQLGDFQLKDCTLYTSCEPCPMCFGAIYWARVKEVYFAFTKHDAKEAGFDDAFIYDELSKRFEERNIPFYQVNVDSPDKPFLEWIQTDEKIEY